MKITPTLTAGNHTGTYRLRKKQELKKKQKNCSAKATATVPSLKNMTQLQELARVFSDILIKCIA